MKPRARIHTVVGARPNFIKAAPLCRALRQHAGAIHHTLIHTGQHYDYEMSALLFEQLDIPRPDVHLGVGSGSHATQTAEVMIRLEQLFDEHPADMVVVIGDVNSTVAAALTAAKRHIPIAHVEAGLRSFDRTMPEEINRLLTDRVSAVLFAPEPVAVRNLRAEGMDPSTVHLVGQNVVDALQQNIGRIREHATVGELHLVPEAFGLVTVHRPANVDSEQALRQLRDILEEAVARGPVVFPVHPRTARRLAALGLDEQLSQLTDLRLTGPLGYLEFMNLMAHAKWVITDSGGIQVETSWLGIPCITLRETTEHRLTVEQGTNTLVGRDVERVSAALQRAARFDRAGYRPPDLWDGQASERMCRVLAACTDQERRDP